MSSKQATNKETDMSFQESTTQVTINEGCFEYILYVPSLWRMNCNVVLPFGDLLMKEEKELCLKAEKVGVDIKDYNANPITFLREFSPESYMKIIDACTSGVPDKWYFIGCSDTGIMSWFRCPSAAWSIEKYLEGVLPGSQLVKIVFTAELGKNDTPVCMPYQCFNGQYQKLKFTPCVTLENDDGTIRPVAIIDCDEQWHSFKPQKNYYSRKSSSNKANEEFPA